MDVFVLKEMINENIITQLANEKMTALAYISYFHKSN